ncbi:MAG: AsmA family protein [Gammaproteobacteria bacterium]|nr:AsmA family protein [Gammaproteobacteria bacterium]
MRFARTFFKILLGLVLLVILAVVLLVIFVKPDQLKPLIVQKVKEATGRDLVLDGTLSWSFYPSLGISTGHLTLSNPAGFQQKTFLEVKRAELGVQLLPLLHGSVEAGRVVLHGVQLNLIKNAKGQSNWGKTTWSVEPSEINAHPSETISSSSHGEAFALVISDLDLTDANVHFEDLKSKQTYDLKNFNLGARNISFSHPFTVKAAFDVSATQPAMKGHFNWSAQASLNPASGVYSFENAMLSGDIQQQVKHIHFTLSGNLIADLNKETFTWEKIQGQFGNAHITGGMNVLHLLSRPLVSGHFAYQPFDLAALLQSMGVVHSPLQFAKNVRGQMSFTASQSAVTAEGVMQSSAMQVSHLKLQNVSARFRLQDKVLDLMPITADLYQGQARAQARVQFNTATPQINLQLTLTDIQSEPLIQDLTNGAHDVSVAGRGNVSLILATLGTEQAALMQNLNGKADFSLTNGYITGMDLSYLLDTAYAFVNKQMQPPQNTGRTPFGQLTGSAIIQNGIVKNEDLMLDAPRFTVNGGGAIDLTSQTINYGVQLTAKKRDSNQKDDLSNLFGMPVPVVVTGALNHPRVGLDTVRLTEAIAKRQIEKTTEQAKGKIQQELGNQLPAKASDLLNNLLSQ